MFKYGSFKLFLIKTLTGAIFVIFAITLFISLITYSQEDPGFKRLVYMDDTNNALGIFGAKLSSTMVVFLGYSSYLISLFFVITGSKLVLGINSLRFFIRVIFLLLGIICVNFFLIIVGLEKFEFGLLPIVFHNLIFDFYLNYINNYFFLYGVSFIVFLIGILMLSYSLSIRLEFIRYLYIVFIPFKFIFNISVLKSFFLFFKKLKKSNVKRNLNKNYIKNEPTILKNQKNIYKNNIKSLESVTKDQTDLYGYKLPPFDMLIKSSDKDTYSREIEKININFAKKLEETLYEYGVEGKIVNFKSGPIVTLFEFVPKAGIKTSKVVGLAEDISRAMSSISARISSQPGKTSIGIEIPNSKRLNVLFGDLVDDEKFKNLNNSLTLALGKNISGDKVFTDLEKMPHLLIAGTTGSGKSVGINTMILSLLFRFKPNECKLILIDPKMLELNIYEDIPHLLTPVVTDPNKAVYALKWVVREMENRYKLMSSVNVKHINSFNQKVIVTLSSGRKLFREVQTGIDNETKKPIIEKREIVLEKMPLIVVVIDEMADLMMVAGKEVESLVQRLAQMARASGIHLITATQRPSVDVITGTIKANFPSRVSYKVASKFDSRTILNEMGAEQLLGSGDMLFLENGANISRLHGGFVSEREVEKIVHYIKQQSIFDYKQEISLQENSLDDTVNLNLINDDVDELYNKAVEIIVSQQKVSTSFIQRYLQIGYNRAARIIEKMEENGVISEANNAGKRQVLKKQ